MLLHEFEFSKSLKPSEKEFEVFRSRFVNKLDVEYLDFLKRQNGGMPSPKLLSSNTLLEYPIILFLGLNSTNSSIMSIYADIKEETSGEDLLPIAKDLANRDICISLKTQQSAVYVVSIDTLYRRSPTTIKKVFDSFRDFVDSLSQPGEPVLEFEILAQREWTDIQTMISKDPKHFLGPPSGELSLLCQTIRMGNLPAFNGLLKAGADITEAMCIAVLNNRIEFVKKLVEFGVPASEGLPYASGPKRIELRDYLSKHI